MKLSEMSDTQIGWVQALFNILVLWGLSHIAIGYCSRILHVNVILFTCISFASSSLMLLSISKHGKLGRETLKSLDTWGYGVILLLTYICVFLLFSKVTATEGSLLLMFGMNVSLIASWFFFGRKPSKGQFLGNIIVFTGLLLTCYDTAEDVKIGVYFLVFVLGIIASIRVFLAESHKAHSKAMEMNDIKSKIRVIAFVMFIVSLLFTFVTVLAAFLKTYYGIQASFLVGFPELKDFLNYKTVFWGIIYGFVLMAPLRFMEFASTSKIKGENYLTVTALSPLATIIWEYGTDSITKLNLETISYLDIIALILITIGAFVAAISQVKKKKDNSDVFKEYLNYSPQELNMIQETREIIANALEHFSSDIEKTSKALNIPKEVIIGILQDKDKVLSFEKGSLRKVSSNYRKNIANADALTGLLNRIGFLTTLKTASFESENLSLFYIDLNKFKPVNDIYGHDAGDFILQKIGERLQKLFGENSLATRLGGDEFCILLIGVNKQDAESKIEIITKELEKEISYKKNKISISGSIGLASYPEDTKSSEELLDLADQQMYTKKSER